MQINSAMFEQNGHSGYVLKPAVMRDRNDPMLERFNPWDKDNDDMKVYSVTFNVQF